MRVSVNQIRLYTSDFLNINERAILFSYITSTRFLLYIVFVLVVCLRYLIVYILNLNGVCLVYFRNKNRGLMSGIC